MYIRFHALVLNAAFDLKKLPLTGQYSLLPSFEEEE